MFNGPLLYIRVAIANLTTIFTSSRYINLLLTNSRYCCLLLLVLFYACKNQQAAPAVTPHIFRLKPGQDLKKEIEQYVQQHQLKAGWVSTCAGSVRQYALRLANQPASDTGSGHFEIVSLSGTVSVNGSHLHLAISDSTGKTIGGHLMDGCTIYTTAEIVLLSTDQVEFLRQQDGTTPWQELQIKTK
jgi:uncharacterized protein